MYFYKDRKANNSRFVYWNLCSTSCKILLLFSLFISPAPGNVAPILYILYGTTQHIKNSYAFIVGKSEDIFTFTRIFACARNYRPCFRQNQPKRSFSIKWKRAFWACFRENWVYKFGHCSYKARKFSLNCEAILRLSSQRSKIHSLICRVFNPRASLWISILDLFLYSILDKSFKRILFHQDF